MELLFETLQPSECQLIEESSEDGKSVWLSGIFMQGDIKNRNGRIYPISEIQKAVIGAQQRIKESNGIFGELDHPQTLTINLDRISHVITELAIDGLNATGKLKLLNTPMGMIGQELVRSGVRIGLSSRGAGNVNESGGVSEFNFVTVDMVATPSAPDALPNAVYESLMNSKHGFKSLSLSEQVKDDPAAQKFLRAGLKKFISEMVAANKFSLK